MGSFHSWHCRYEIDRFCHFPCAAVIETLSIDGRGARPNISVSYRIRSCACQNPNTKPLGRKSVGGGQLNSFQHHACYINRTYQVRLVDCSRLFLDSFDPIFLQGLTKLPDDLVPSRNAGDVVFPPDFETVQPRVNCNCTRRGLRVA